MLRDRTFLALCVLILVNQIGFGLMTPVLPAYSRSFGLGASEVGLGVIADAAVTEQGRR